MVRVEPTALRRWLSTDPQRRNASVANGLSPASTRVRRRARTPHTTTASGAIARICAILAAVAALPLMVQTNSGCGFQGQALDPVDTNAYTCACSCSPALRHRTLRIAAANDDAEQQLDGTILLNSGDLDFQTGRFVALRFPNVQIPAGSQIFAANVQFTASSGSTAGALTGRLTGEAVANAGPFTTTPGSIGALPNTASSVQWDLPNWPTAGTAGGDQSTPNLKTVVQEIINQPAWASGNAFVVIFRGTAGAAIRKAFSFDGNPGAAAAITIEYQEPTPTIVGPQDLPICLPPALVPNRSETDLANDCSDRVAPTLSGLAEACGYPSDCHCGLQANASTFTASLKWADSCSTACTEEPVDVANDCKNFDPVNGLTSATNAPGDQPVCLANSPLSAEIFGRRTTCAVSGTAHVEVDDESKNPHAEGIVQFVGNPCPGASCAVGMEYQLDIASVTFGNFFHSETFRDLGGIGETSAGNEALLSPTGDGSFARDAAGVSAQGRRGSQLNGLATTNDDPVDVQVGWDQPAPTCRVNGRLIGSVDPELKRCENAGPDANKICEDDADCAQDDDCSDKVCNCEATGDTGVSLSLDVTGDILNQPPTADAGAEQTVECVNAAVTHIVLDASASSDPDANIALYSWRLGTRTGQEVGFEEKSTVEQSLGSQTYVLRVIDDLAQADEAATHVTVSDTIPPSVSCTVQTPLLKKTNHALVNVGLASNAVDQCEGTLPVAVNVFADEDDNGTGDGNTSPDAADIDVGSLQLRGERKGNGDGRVYLIVTEATDSSGNRGFGCCTVAVPHSSSAASVQSVESQAAAARAFCRANDGTPPAGYFVVGD